MLLPCHQKLSLELKFYVQEILSRFSNFNYILTNRPVVRMTKLANGGPSFFSYLYSYKLLYVLKKCRILITT